MMFVHCVLHSPSVLCPSLSLDNGMVTYNDTTLGPNTVATHTCNPSYTLSGESMRYCGSDGQWSAEAPTCTTLGTRYSVVQSHSTHCITNTCSGPGTISLSDNYHLFYFL